MSYFDDASLVMIPSGYKTSKVYSVKPTDGTGDLTFTRSNDTATRVGPDGLIEKVRTNLFTYSNTFSNAAWTKNNTTLTSGQSDPFGGTNAWKMEAVITAQSDVRQSVSGAAGYSIYAKAGNYDFFSLWTGAAAVAFNLTAGTAGAGGTITSVGNGWYRCSVATSTTGSVVLIPFFSANAGDFVYIAFAQAESSDVATDYIATTSAAVSVGPVANVPRLDYLNSSCPRLLLEPQRQNIFPKSESSDTWSFTNMTRTANHGIAPDGYQSADLLAPTTSGSVAFQSDFTTSSLVIGQPFVVSFFIKLNASFTSNVGTNILDIRLSGPTVWSRPTVRVNLETGEVTNINNAIYISSTNFGDGWFRITFGATPTGTSGVVALQSPTTVTMDGGSFYIWGLQGEANATYDSSYIPTLGAAVTRGADAASKTGISSLIGQTEGTMYWEGYSENNASFGTCLALQGSAGYWIYILSYNGGFTFEMRNAYVVSMAYNSTSAAGNYKIAIGYNASQVVIYINGTLVHTDNSVTIPALSSVYLANWENVYNESVKTGQALLFKTRLSNADLAALTA